MLDEKHYQAIEAGGSNVTFATLIAVAKAHGLSLAELLEGV